MRGFTADFKTCENYPKFRTKILNSDATSCEDSKSKDFEKAFTLIETILFTTLVAALSIVSVGGIINFKSEATLDNMSHELISEIRSARSKSMNGELLEGENNDMFGSDGLPEYGIAINTGSYKLIRKCLKADLTICEDDPPVKSVNLDSGYTLSPAVTFYFQRISGASGNQTITLTDKSGVHKRQINISNNSVITVTKI